MYKQYVHSECFRSSTLDTNVVETIVNNSNKTLKHILFILISLDCYNWRIIDSIVAFIMLLYKLKVTVWLINRKYVNPIYG